MNVASSLPPSIPGYRIQRILGRGGMATVYLAVQQGFEREVALKVMSPALSADIGFGQRFLREARIVSQLVHPNIVTVFDVGQANGYHYLAMEYIEGHDVKAIHRQLLLADSLRIVSAVAQALDVASNKGYVHRDIKPENIMLQTSDGRVVLMDFGIARATDGDISMTQTGTTIGTPHYMSPEQAKGLPVDCRADLYSLGVVLFLLLTGFVPYDGDSAVAVGIRHVSEPIPTLPKHLAIFQTVVDKVLAKAPEHRYQSGAELSRALSAITPDDLASVEVLRERSFQESAAALSAEDGLSHTQPTLITPLSAARAQSIVSGASRPAPGAVDAPLGLAPADDLAITQPIPTLPIGASYSPPPIVAAAVDGESPWRVMAWGLSAAAIVVAVFFVWLNPQTVDAWVVSRLADINAAVAEPAANTPEPVADEPMPESIPSATGRDITPKAMSTPANYVSDPAPDPQLIIRTTDLWQQWRDASTSDAPDNAVALVNHIQRQAALAVDDAQQQYWLQQQQRWLQRVQQQLQQALDTYDTTLVATWWQAITSVGLQERKIFDQTAITTAIERLQQADHTLQMAQVYLDANALTQPPAENALAAYQQVLAIWPEHTEAQAGLEHIVKRYWLLAQQAVSRQQWDKAAGYYQRASDVLALSEWTTEPSDWRQRWQQAQNQWRDQQQHISQQSQQIQQHLSLARRFLDAGQLLGPGDNALSQYRQVLTLQPQHSEAQTAIAALRRRTREQVVEAINQGEWAMAEQALSVWRKAFDDSAEEAKVLTRQLQSARLPIIEAVRIQPQPEPLAVNSVQADNTQAVQRTLQVSFQHRNFAQTTVLQAHLYDGARSVQIAQVPVVITPVAGVQSFVIERPVEGFSEGQYLIELLLQEQILAEKRFTVSSPRSQAE